MTDKTQMTIDESSMTMPFELRDMVYLLEGLIVAADEMSERIGPKGGPVIACIMSARKVAEELSVMVGRA